MTTTIDRRAALGALASLPALLVPAVAVAGKSDGLSDLITAHREAFAAFRVASDELEAAGPGYHTLFSGIGDREYKLGRGQDEIMKWITAHVEEHAVVLRRIDQLSPGAAAQALAALERERDAIFARLEAIFAPEVAAREIYDEASAAESDALLAICEYRCQSPDELIRKLRFIKEYEVELQTEEYDAILEALLPDGDLEEA